MSADSDECSKRGETRASFTVGEDESIEGLKAGSHHDASAVHVLNPHAAFDPLDSHSFRIRVDQSPNETIEDAESGLSLSASADPVRISLRVNTSRNASREAQHVVLSGAGYATEEDAKRAGQSYESILRVALARLRVGVDFGSRSAKGLFTNSGLSWLEMLNGKRVLNDIHGLMIFSTEPPPHFAITALNVLRITSKEAFLQTFSAAESARPTVNERERLAFTLFNASFFQPTVDTRFLLLVMAVEALIDPKSRPKESLDHINALIASTRTAAIDKNEKESILGAIRWLKNESIRQAGKRFVTERLDARQYDGRAAEDFFSLIYQLRSNLVHGNLPYPSHETIGSVVHTLEVFVSELLTAPFLGLPDQTPDGA